MNRSPVARRAAAAGIPVILAALVLGSPAAFADAPLEGTKPAQWRLVWTTEPATTAKALWNTAAPGKEHTLLIGKRG